MFGNDRRCFLEVIFKILQNSREEPVSNTFFIWHDDNMKNLILLSLLVALSASLQPVFSANVKDVKRLKLLRMCEGCDLSDAKLRYADLKNAVLVGANLSGADLKAADLSGANLTGANLTNADLSESDLNGSVLVDADLRGAELYNSNLLRSDLRGADLSTIEIDASRLIEATICKTKTKAGEQNRDCS
jgi:hypothetical protein